MRLIQQLNTIARIDNLIRCKATGTPEQLAEKIGVDRATIYRYKDVMKDEMDAPIRYNREQQSFIYTEEWSLKKFFEENF